MSEEDVPEAVREYARLMAHKSWQRTQDRAARTAAGRKAALETFARRRAEKEAAQKVR
jgi:hypothetical protein